jgi:gamma-tubulin complex component 5
MSLNFSDGFVTFAGNTTHDISHLSLVIRRHRSRRQKRQRRNTIGFTDSHLAGDDSSDSDSEPDESDILREHDQDFSYSFAAPSATDEEFLGHIGKMSSELDGLIRYIRRGVESLAEGTSEAASAFGIFAFALEDWDK